MPTAEEYIVILPVIPVIPIVYTKPGQISYSNNPMSWLFSAQHRPASGTKAYWVFPLDGSFWGADSRFRLHSPVFPDGYIELTAKPNPSSDGFQFKSQPPSTGVPESFVENLANNYLVSKYYNISYVYPFKVRIEAKKFGSQYSIIATTYLPATGIGWFIYPTSWNAGSDPAASDNHQMIAFLDIYEAGVWKQLVELVQVPDDDGNVEFDVSQYLHDYILFSTIYSYRLRIYEQSGDNVYFREITDTRQVIKGGVSKVKFPSVRGQSLTYAFPREILSNLPAERVILYNEVVLLPFLVVFPKVGDIKADITITYTDSSTDTTEITITAEANYDINSLIIPRIGIEYNNLDDLNPDKTIRKFDIFFKSIYLLTKTITFNLISASPVSRALYYISSMGFTESLHTRARRVDGVIIAKDIISARLRFNYAPWEHQKFAQTREFQYKYEASTGLFDTIDELMNSVDFLISPNTWILEDNIPYQIYIPEGDYELRRDDDGRYFISFEYFKSFADKNFSL